jgi:hypothetical protein
VSASLPDHPSDHRGAQPPAGIKAAGACRLHIEVAFSDLDERSAQGLAAEMIARAHELANRPEHECDVDVSVQLVASGSGADLRGQADQVRLAPVAAPGEDSTMPRDGQLAPRGPAGRRAAAR